MKEAIASLNERIATRVSALRSARDLSLDELAARSGVSRSMISLIERGESSPTAAVLEKLAAGLGVTLASLFDAPAAEGHVPRGPVARRDDQPEWQDPASGYLRRNVSPPGVPQPMQIVDVHFPAGGRVAFDTGSARRARAPAGVGARRLNRRHAGRRAPSAARRRLPGHAARQPDDVPQPDAKAGALRRGDRVRGLVETMSAAAWTIRRLHALDEAQIDALASVLIDCVDGGASVSFMHPLTRERAVAFWRRVAQGVAAGERALLVAEDEHGICGTVQLVMDLPENQPHRADLAKMLVHRRVRRQGLGAALMRAAEATARECGKTLLVLDAVTGGDAARLYERLGWVRVGDIPGYALMPQGDLCSTTVFYRNL